MEHAAVAMQFTSARAVVCNVWVCCWRSSPAMPHCGLARACAGNDPARTCGAAWTARETRKSALPSLTTITRMSQCMLGWQGAVGIHSLAPAVVALNQCTCSIVASPAGILEPHIQQVCTLLAVRRTLIQNVLALCIWRRLSEQACRGSAL